MKRVILYTVPGTGTRFTKLFLIDVLNYKDEDMQLAHCMSPMFEEKYPTVTAGKAVVVSTLRDPYLSSLSRPHGRITMNPHNLGHGQVSESGKKRSNLQWTAFIANWDKLQADGHDVVFMNVDETDPAKRRTILENIAAHCEATYNQGAFDSFLAAWEPVGKSKMTAHKEEYLDSGTLNGEVPDWLDTVVSWQADRSGVNV